MKKTPLGERFWAKVDKNGPVHPVIGTRCWLWTAAHSFDGYGHIGVEGRTVNAHRVSWELHFGPIPDGKQVLHRCDVRDCMNPDHFFLGTNLDNTRDRDAKGRHGRPNRRKTHCKFGHAFDEANTHICTNGARKCRACDRDRYHQKKAA